MDTYSTRVLHFFVYRSLRDDAKVTLAPLISDPCHFFSHHTTQSARTNRFVDWDSRLVKIKKIEYKYLKKDEKC